MCLVDSTCYKSSSRLPFQYLDLAQACSRQGVKDHMTACERGAPHVAKKSPAKIYVSSQVSRNRKPWSFYRLSQDIYRKVFTINAMSLVSADRHSGHVVFSSNATELICSCVRHCCFYPKVASAVYMLLLKRERSDIFSWLLYQSVVKTRDIWYANAKEPKSVKANPLLVVPSTGEIFDIWDV